MAIITFWLLYIIRKLAIDQPKEWDIHLDTALFTCRVRTQKTTALSPFYMAYGVQPRIPGDVINPRLLMSKPVNLEEIQSWRQEQLEKLALERQASFERQQQEQLKSKELFDRKVDNSEQLEEGDLVYVKNMTRTKFEPFWFGPLKIKKCISNGLFKLETLEGKEEKDLYHRMRLKKVECL